MARDEDTAQEQCDTEATAELRHVLAAHFKGRPLPPDLVITTRTEIEQREFRAYGKGWRDRGEHDERRRAEATGGTEATGATGATGAKIRRPSPTEATVLPFPHPSGPTSARPHPNDERR
ncbi:hypothetical protein AB0D74_46035 [Streptomyces sp. NPDC048278]|uniref:hypothetical protein n=1 Tax=unclassified Streptomyces TaxID=2593676 RepID=UPI00341CA976